MTEIGNAQRATKYGILFQSLLRTIALTNPSGQSRPSITCARQKKHAPLVEETRNPREKRLYKKVLTSIIKKF